MLRAEAPPIALLQAVHQPGLQCILRGDGRSRLTLNVANHGAAATRVQIPGGLVCKSAAGALVIVLRGADLDVPAGGAATAEIPAAALSSKNLPEDVAFDPIPDPELKLAPLLTYLATKNDVPKGTSQLVALALLEDVNFTQWEEFLAPARKSEPSGQTHPTPAEITEAVDALGLLRELAPAGVFSLAADSSLKLRALRNPWSRAKAMLLYGMTIPGDAPPGAVPPDLSQLLHTKPGDNCPICRMRAQMQGAPSDL